MKTVGKLVWSIVLISTMVAISGCGKKAEKTGRIKLRVSCYSGPVANEVRSALYKKFEETHPNVEISFEPISQSYTGKILTQYAGGLCPDIFFTEPNFLSGIAKEGVALPLNPFIEADKTFNLDDFYPMSLEAYTHDETLYALPGGITPFVLFYNKDIFDEEGVEYPSENWTWDDLVEVAQKLTKRDEKGRPIQFGLIPPATINLCIFIYQNGGRIYTEDMQKCIVDNPEALEAFQFYHDLRHKYRVSPTAAEETFMASDGILYRTGKVAMWYLGRWGSLRLKREAKFRWGVAPLPKKKERKSMIASHGWVICSQCKHPEMAWEFLKFITGLEGARAVVEMGDLCPALKPLEKEFVENPAYSSGEDNHVYLRELEYGFLDPVFRVPASGSEVQTVWNDELGRLEAGVQNVKETLERIQKRINKLIEESKAKDES